MAISSSSRLEKLSPPTSPILRGRSPFKHVPSNNPKKQKRARTLGRLAMVLIVLILLGVLIKEWVCGNGHACFARPEWFEASNKQWVGGGSVIGQAGFGDGQGQLGDVVLVDSGGQDRDEDEPVHVHVEHGGGDGMGNVGGAGIEAPMVGTMEMSVY